MDTFSQSEVFFFISSVGFVFLWILAAIFLFYLIRVAGSFSRIMDKMERDINNIGDTTKEIFLEMKDNPIFRFFFSRKKKSRKN